MPEKGEVYQRITGIGARRGMAVGDVVIVEKIEVGWAMVLVPRLGHTMAVRVWELSDQNFWKKLTQEASDA
jgi:hypothetical protein